MQRNRRYQQTKPFVSGGTYNPQQNSNDTLQRNQQQQQFSTPTRQQTRNQQSTSQPQQYQQQNNQGNGNNYNGQHEDIPQEQPVAPDPPIIRLDNDDDDEMAANNGGNDNYDDENDGNENDDGDGESSPAKKGKIGFKKIFLIRKKSSVRAREKKIRQNRQLRKAITPKNALMALNEVKGIQLSDFVFNSNPTGGFIATVTVNNTQYEGKGASKISAKNDACEKALRDYVIAKMVRKPRSTKKNSGNQAEPEPMEADDDANADKESVASNGANDEPDDVPMLNLASFALFKLFNEWENEGFHVPELHLAHPATPSNPGTNNGSPVPKEPKKASIRTELPPNWKTMHPATLLCMMRPGTQYSDLGAMGEKPNVMQKLSVNIDGKEFFGIGRSKKVARKNAAISACNTLFNTDFVDEGVNCTAE